MTLEQVRDGSGHTLTVRNFNGYRLPDFPVESFKGLSTFQFRDDDILISNYPKSGTHWVFEIVRMLLAGKTDIPLMEKEVSMIEIDLTNIVFLPSPRILNTHLLFRQLPGLRNVKCKIINITRNPRDVAVSFYNHHKMLTEFYHYEGTWEDYFHLFINGELDYGSWFDYTRDWEQIIASHPELRTIKVCFEDIKENPFVEVSRISQFLGQNHSSAFIQSVCDSCSFAQMRSRKGNMETTADGQPIMYRKGEVGDWQNWFSPEQVSLMDEVYRQKMAGSTYVPRYTLQEKTNTSAASV